MFHLIFFPSTQHLLVFLISPNLDRTTEEEQDAEAVCVDADKAGNKTCTEIVKEDACVAQDASQKKCVFQKKAAEGAEESSGKKQHIIKKKEIDKHFPQAATTPQRAPKSLRPVSTRAMTPIPTSARI